MKPPRRRARWRRIVKQLVTGILIAALCAGTSATLARADGSVGSVAPDFQLADVRTGATGTFTLSQYRGSIVVIAFFAHW